MTYKVHFSLPGDPKAKGRARSFVRNGHVGHYTPGPTRSYEGMVRLAAERAMAGRPRMERAVILHLVAVFDVPKTYSKKRREACLSGSEFPAKKPDWDNLAKIFTDAMNTVVFKDDAQIVSAVVSKVYGPAPMMAVTVTEL